MENISINQASAPAGHGAPELAPDLKDSAILIMDAMLTLLRLGKTEAVQAFAAVPQLMGLYFFRLPAMLLTWVSFSALVACSVYSLSHNAVFTALSFFALQLALTVQLERRFRRVRARLTFVETRQGLATFQAGLRERFAHEAR